MKFRGHGQVVPKFISLAGLQSGWTLKYRYYVGVTALAFALVGISSVW